MSKSTRIYITLLAAFVLAFAACVPGPREWNAGHMTEVRFRVGVPGELANSVSEAKELTEILACFRRAVVVDSVSTEQKWPFCFDLVGERPEAGRWLYQDHTDSPACPTPGSRSTGSHNPIAQCLTPTSNGPPPNVEFPRLAPVNAEAGLTLIRLH